MHVTFFEIYWFSYSEISCVCFRYGWIFLYETYLYHIVRKDIRHNFSPYFYMMYLTSVDEASFLIKFLTFCPQLLLLVAIAIRFHGDLPLSCFLCTFTFVMFNKVCTSQVGLDLGHQNCFVVCNRSSEFNLQCVCA